MKKNLTSILAIGIGLFALSGVVFAQFQAPQPFKKSGANWLMNSATEELGSTGSRIAKIWATELDTQTLTISAVTSGATTLSTTTVEYFTTGGRAYATTTATTTSALTLQEIEMRVGRIDITPSVPGQTITLTATSSLTNLVPNNADGNCSLLTNATTTLGSDGAFTLAAGTGMTLKNSSSTMVLRSGDITPICLHRKANTDIFLSVNPR